MIDRLRPLIRGKTPIRPIDALRGGGGALLGLMLAGLLGRLAVGGGVPGRPGRRPSSWGNGSVGPFATRSTTTMIAKPHSSSATPPPVALLENSRMISTVFDGISRHTREGYAFQQRAAEVGFRQAVRERDGSPYDDHGPRTSNVTNPASQPEG